MSTRQVAFLGIALGILGCWLTLPPVALRNSAAPIAFGILAIAAGIWAWSRSERRPAGGAVAAGLLCIALGFGATRSSVANLDSVVVWGALGAATLRYATPLVYAALGGLYCERAGVVNVALEGMLLSGAFFGIWAAVWAHGWAGNSAWLVGLAGAAVSGAVFGAVHAVWSIQFKVDQIISGTAINFLALGITGYLFQDHFGANGTPGNVTDYGIPDIHLHFLDGIPFVGPVFGSLNLMIWLSFVLLVGTWLVVFKTPFGLRLRAVGEHPRAADTVGISVYRTRYAAVVGSGAIAALGGAYLSIGFVHSFTENMTMGRGFIGLAALIFGKWRPFPTFAATLLFGFASALADRLQTYGTQWGSLFEALPYVLTLVAVAGIVGRSIGPAAAGRPYDVQ